MTDTDVGASTGRSQSGTGDTSPKEMASKAAQAVKQEAQSFAASAQDKAIDRVEQTKETATRTLGDLPTRCARPATNSRRATSRRRAGWFRKRPTAWKGSRDRSPTSVLRNCWTRSAT